MSKSSYDYTLVGPDTAQLYVEAQKLEQVVNRLPGLADVPYLGALFRSLSRTRKKTNLVVFLRPLVMRDDTATDELSIDRYEQIRARQRELPTDVNQVLPENDAPLLPARAP